MDGLSNADLDDIEHALRNAGCRIGPFSVLRRMKALVRAIGVSQPLSSVSSAGDIFSKFSSLHAKVG